MRSVSAREANQHFSALLARVEEGEEVVVTKRGRPVAVLKPYEPPELTPERKEAIARLMAMLDKGFPWPKDFKMPSRDEIYDRFDRDRDR